MKRTTQSDMQAVALDQFGGPEALKLQTLPVPEVGPDEVLVRVESAGVGVWDPFEREGGYAEMLGIEPQFLAAFSLAAIGIYFFPANGSQVTSIATDETGSTHITKYAIWHSFSLPMFVMWLVSTVVAVLVALLVYGT